MKRNTETKAPIVSCGAGLLALLLSGSVGLQAQQPALAATLTRSPMHRLMAQVDPGPVMPEPPQNNANTAPMKDDLFAGTEKFAKGASDVTEVNMDPNSLDLVGGPDSHRAHNMILNVVRTYSYDKPGMYNPADVDEFRRRLETGDWHCSIHTRDLKSGESTDVCSKRRGSDMIEQAIITVEPKSLTFIHNIRRINRGKDDGSRLEMEGFPGIVMVPGLSMEASMAALAPEIQAEMLAATAQMRAQAPLMAEQMRQFHFDMPAMNREMKNFKFEFSPEQKRQLEDMQKHMKLFMQVPAPPVPPTPPAPPAPGTPEAPPAPAVPETPAAPPAPPAPQGPPAPQPPPVPQPPPAPQTPPAPATPHTSPAPSTPSSPAL